MRRRLTQLLLATALMAAASAPAEAAKAPAAHPRVTIAQGTLEGATTANGTAFLDVPYAAAPVGKLRFRPPARPARWKGVRDATRLGSQCIQFFPGAREGSTFSEDCLDLNIFLPSHTKTSSRLPVLVFVHGGANAAGSGTEYNGQRLVNREGIAVVTISYRLGMLGGLALPQLDAEQRRTGSGNYGLQDQIAALTWIKHNIGAFGGDPSKVTVSGQSAGAEDVCAILASPASRGLYRSAVIQSAGSGCSQPLDTVTGSYADGRSYAAAAGCDDSKSVLSCLRDASVEDLTAAASAALTQNPKSGSPLLPESPVTAFADGRWNQVPVVIGSTHDEAKYFLADQTGITYDQYVATVTKRYGAKAPKVLARYPVSPSAVPPQVFYTYAALVTDSGFGCNPQTSSGLTSRRVPTYRYEFWDTQGPNTWDTEIPGVNMSSEHVADLAYLFDTTDVDEALLPASARLSARMMDYWGGFVRTGSPSGKNCGDWPTYSTSRPRVLQFQPTGDHVITDFDAEHNCSFWQSL